jgi:hypothetical protein
MRLGGFEKREKKEIMALVRRLKNGFFVLQRCNPGWIATAITESETGGDYNRMILKNQGRQTGRLNGVKNGVFCSIFQGKKALFEISV